MEELFEFLFGASGRINWAKYWRSLLIFCSAGLLVGVILLTAAGLAAPLFHPHAHDRLHPMAAVWASLSTLSDCMTAAKAHGGLLVFYAAPGVLGQLAKGAWLAGAAGTGLPVRTGAGRRCALDLGICLKSAACAATPDQTNTAQIRFQCMPPEADYSAAKAVAQLKS